MNVPLAIPPRKSAAHSSRTLLRGWNPNPAVLKKSVGAKQILCSRKKCFALPRQHFAPPPARIHGGQNTKEKCPFLFQEKFHHHIREARNIFLWCCREKRGSGGTIHSISGFCWKKVRISSYRGSQLGLLASSSTKLNGERIVNSIFLAFTVGF